MSDDVPFDRSLPQFTDRSEALSRRVRRVMAANAGPFTFTGTCSYIVGEGRVAIIDPGPADDGHLAALLGAVAGERVEAILVTHTHRDHSSLVPALKQATGAPTYGAGPHRMARPLHLGEANLLDAAADHAFQPDIILADGDVVSAPGWDLTALATPGHCANHLAFALDGDEVLFSGDHVMAWSTTIVAPPDGAMGDYVASLQKLVGRPEARYYPGHGNPVMEPQRFLRGLIHHRRMREGAILKALTQGPAAIPAIVAKVYVGLAPALIGAASLNTLAHLEDLVSQGLVSTESAPSIAGTYSLAGGASARVRSSSRKPATRRALAPKS